MYHRTQERLIVPPAVEPITATEAARSCRQDGDFDLDYIQGLVTTARKTLEKWCWSAFIQQTWQYWFDRYYWEMFIPRGPMRTGWNAPGANDPMRPQEGTNCGGVVWIKYLTPGASANPSGLITLPTSIYETSEQNEIPYVRQAFLQTFPVTRGYRDDVTMRVVLGYGPNPEDVPQPLRHAIKLLVAQLYANRGEIDAELPSAITHLIEPFRLKEF